MILYLSYFFIFYTYLQIHYTFIGYIWIFNYFLILSPLPQALRVATTCVGFIVSVLVIIYKQCCHRRRISNAARPGIVCRWSRRTAGRHDANGHDFVAPPVRVAAQYADSAWGFSRTPGAAVGRDFITRNKVKHERQS